MYSEPIRIISDENFTDYGFPGYGNYTHPYIIESLHINDTWEGTAIYVQDTTKHFQIRDCYLNTESYGVVIKDVSNGTATIIGNYCQDSAGIYLLNATGSKIINNTVTLKNGYGIQALMSHYLSIENNTCFDLSFNGIDLYQCNYTSVIGNNCSWNERSGMKIDNSFYTEISKNILLANKEDSGWSCGIYINSCEFTVFSENFFEDNDDGLRIYDCREILVHNNSFRNNEYSYGIKVIRTSDCIFTNNTLFRNTFGISFSGSNSVIKFNQFQENKYHAISLDQDSHQNLIYYNYFIDNNIDGFYTGDAQTSDYNSTNSWYDEELKIGNWWSDLGPLLRYRIDGEANAVDRYPINIANFTIDKILITILVPAILIPTIILMIRKTVLKFRNRQ